MTIESMKELYERVSKERQENLPRYTEIMNKYFPNKMCSQYDRFKNDGGEYGLYKREERTEEEWQGAWKYYLKYHKGYENGGLYNDYADDFRDPQDGSFYGLFSYEMMWGDDKIPEADFIRRFHSVVSTYASCKNFLENPEGNRLEDSEPLFFDHEDILITDPCYILVKEEGDHKDDWHKCNYGSNFEVLGIHKYITRDTLYGDWGCTVWNKDTKEEIGEFCADAGLVSILSLDEVKAYNPDIEKWCEEHKWCATIIRDFTGKAQIKVGFSDGDKKDEEDEPIYYEFYCYVEGEGLKDEGSINFYGGQTGF